MQLLNKGLFVILLNLDLDGEVESLGEFGFGISDKRHENGDLVKESLELVLFFTANFTARIHKDAFFFGANPDLVTSAREERE